MTFPRPVRNFLLSLVAVCVAGLAPPMALGQTIIWTDRNAKKIQSKDVAGGSVATIKQFSSPLIPVTIYYDPITACLYYLLNGGTPNPSIWRANLDGSDAGLVPTPSAGSFALNVDSRKLYWYSSLTRYRAELNGTVVDSHTYPACCPSWMVAFGENLFFGAGGTMNKGLWRADPDGSNQQFIHGASEPQGLAYDPVESKIYYAGIEQIYRMNLDGTEFETLPLPFFTPGTVLVDAQSRKLYWADLDAQSIRRSNLDGTGVENFVTTTETGNPNFEMGGLTIVYTPTPIPAVAGWGLVVMTALIGAAGLVILRKRPRCRVEFTDLSPSWESASSPVLVELGENKMRNFGKHVRESSRFGPCAVAFFAVLWGGGRSLNAIPNPVPVVRMRCPFLAVLVRLRVSVA